MNQYLVNGGGGGVGERTNETGRRNVPHGGVMSSSGGTDKWYLKDSMVPIDSSQHGGNCKCYRCQRKLTAI